MFTRVALGLLLVLSLSTCAADQNDCEISGGACEELSFGECTGAVVSDDVTSCGSQGVCCLPLSLSLCERGGGTCVVNRGVGCTGGSAINEACDSAGSDICCPAPFDAGR